MDLSREQELRTNKHILLVKQRQNGLRLRASTLDSKILGFCYRLGHLPSVCTLVSNLIFLKINFVFN